MDGDLILIFGFVIVALVIVTRAVKEMVYRSLEHREQRLGMVKGKAAGADREDYRKLEERVRVLERLVTDRGPTLAQEIEQLREPQAEIEEKELSK